MSSMKVALPETWPWSHIITPNSDGSTEVASECRGGREGGKEGKKEGGREGGRREGGKAGMKEGVRRRDGGRRMH